MLFPGFSKQKIQFKKIQQELNWKCQESVPHPCISPAAADLTNNIRPVSPKFLKHVEELLILLPSLLTLISCSLEFLMAFTICLL